MDYRMLILPLMGVLYWKRYEIVQNSFTIYAKVKITLDKYFPKSNTHKLIKIEYYNNNNTIFPVDLTNKFRNELENNGNISWKKIFDEMKEENEEARIEITYKIRDQQYKCTFTYSDNESNLIKFPLYDEDDIIRHEKSSKFKNIILSANVGDTEVTELIQQHHGPLQDFHNGIGSKVIPSWIIKDNTKELEVIDSMANIHIIKHNDAHIKINE